MAKVVPGRSWPHVHITSPNNFSYFKGPYSLQKQKTKTHNDTDQANKHSKQ